MKVSHAIYTIILVTILCNLPDETDTLTLQDIDKLVFDECSVKIDERTICGNKADTKETCEQKGCCYNFTNGAEIRCYFKKVDWRLRLYPFTKNATEILAGQDDASEEISNLPFPLAYCDGKQATKIYVCTNGLISLSSKYCPYEPKEYGTELRVEYPVIAPFYTDLTLTPPSNIEEYFSTITVKLAIQGNENDREILQRASTDVSNLIGNNGFIPVWVYIITWYNVRAWGSTEGVTFQSAIITDGVESFVRFSYGQMLWATFYKPAQVGYSLSTLNSSCQQSLNVPLTGHTPFRYPLDKISGNSGYKGIWMYRFTKEIERIMDLEKINITLKMIGVNETTDHVFYANVGQQIMMFCSLSKPTYLPFVWWKGDVTLNESSSLFILKVQANENGQYECGLKSGHELKKSTTAIRIQVKQLGKPLLIFYPKQSVLLGNTISITCSTTSFPVPTYKWYHEGIELKNVFNQTIVIKNVTWPESGIYQCEVTNSIGTLKSEQLELTLFELTSPNIISSIEGYVYVGATVILSCSTTDNVESKTTWWSSKQGDLNSTSATLIISNITKEDSDISYWCQAEKNGVTKLSRKISFTVTYFTKAVISSQSSNVFRSGDNISLVCRADAVPLPDRYNWYLEDKLLSNQSSHVLKLYNITKEQNGLYTCRLRHWLGIFYARFLLEISYFDVPVIENQAGNPVKEGSSINISCHIKSSKFETYELIWRHDHKIVSNNTLLTLNNITRKMEGKYECVAKAGSYNKSSFIDLTVLYLDYNLLINNPNANPKEGDNITLSASGFTFLQESEFSWLYNGNTVSRGRNYVLKNITLKMAGIYQIMVHSTLGMSIATLNLKIYYLHKPVVVKYHNDELKMGDSIFLNCISESSQQIRYTWLKDGNTLQNQNTDVLILKNITKLQNGNYQCCVATNLSNGRNAKYSEEITVHVFYIATPTISEDKIHTEIPLNKIAGDFLNLTCNSDGFPNVTYQWYYNGNFLLTGSQLVYVNLSANHTGTYECLASNYAQEKRKTISLNVDYLTRPTLTVSPSSFVDEGENILMKCYATGLSEIVYEWRLNSKLLFHTSPWLLLNNIRRTYNGILNCAVKNNAGTMYSEDVVINIKYLDPPVLTTYNTSSHTTYNVTTQGNPAPAFKWTLDSRILSTENTFVINNTFYLQDLKCTVANGAGEFTIGVGERRKFLQKPIINIIQQNDIWEGDTVILTCSIDDKSAVKFNWMKDNKVFNMTSNVLILKDISKNESGSYLCEVRSESEKTISYSAVLKVNYLSTPSISYSKEVNALKQGDTIQLSCDSESNLYISHHWYFNNSMIHTGRNLIISNIQFDNQGFYICKVAADNKTKVSSVFLEVNFMMIPIIFMFPSSFIAEGNSVTLSCVSFSNKIVTYNWFRNGELLAETTSKYMIASVKRDLDNGNYTCLTVNRYDNKVSMDQTLNVNYLDIPKIEVQYSKTSDVQAITLSCSTNGNPKPNRIFWARGLKEISNESTIHLKSKNDSDLYTCHVTSEEGKRENSLMIKIKYLFTPTVNINPATDPFETNTIILECLVEGSSPLSYQWLKDNTTLGFYGKTLVFKNISRRIHDGIYRCEVENYFGKKISDEFNLLVLYFDQPIIEIDITSPQENDDIKFSVSLSSNTPIKYTWYKDGIFLLTGYQFELQNITFEASGLYHVLAENDYGMTKVSTYYLTVKKPSFGIPACELRKRINLKNGILRCVCADGFYGADCSIPSKSVKVSVDLNTVCMNSNCAASYELVAQIQNPQFYPQMKTAIEKNLLATLQQEVSSTKVYGVNSLQYSLIQNKTKVMLDFFIFFNSSANLTVAELQKQLVYVVSDYFSNDNYKRNQTVAFQLDKNTVNVSDYDHCQSQNTICDDSAECVDGIMSYQCRCISGYEGDGVVCRKILGCYKEVEMGHKKDYFYATYGLSALLGGLLMLLICVLCYCCLCSKRRRKRSRRRTSITLTTLPVSNTESLRTKSLTAVQTTKMDQCGSYWINNKNNVNNELPLSTLTQQFNGNSNDGYLDEEIRVINNKNIKRFSPDVTDNNESSQSIMERTTGVSNKTQLGFSHENRRFSADFIFKSLQSLSSSSLSRSKSDLSYQSGTAFYSSKLTLINNASSTMSLKNVNFNQHSRKTKDMPRSMHPLLKTQRSRSTPNISHEFTAKNETKSRACCVVRPEAYSSVVVMNPPKGFSKASCPQVETQEESCKVKDDVCCQNDNIKFNSLFKSVQPPLKPGHIDAKETQHIPLSFLKHSTKNEQSQRFKDNDSRYPMETELPSIRVRSATLRVTACNPTGYSTHKHGAEKTLLNNCDQKLISQQTNLLGTSSTFSLPKDEKDVSYIRDDCSPAIRFFGSYNGSQSDKRNGHMKVDKKNGQNAVPYVQESFSSDNDKELAKSKISYKGVYSSDEKKFHRAISSSFKDNHVVDSHTFKQVLTSHSKLLHTRSNTDLDLKVVGNPSMFYNPIRQSKSGSIDINNVESNDQTPSTVIKKEEIEIAEIINDRKGRDNKKVIFLKKPCESNQNLKCVDIEKKNSQACFIYRTQNGKEAQNKEELSCESEFVTPQKPRNTIVKAEINNQSSRNYRNSYRSEGVSNDRRGSSDVLLPFLSQKKSYLSKVRKITSKRNNVLCENLKRRQTLRRSFQRTTPYYKGLPITNPFYIPDVITG